MGTLKDVLRIIVGKTPANPRSPHAMDADEKDGFGPIRTTQQSPETHQQTENTKATQCIIEVCTTFLAVAPILQSSSGEPTRDRELTELVLECSVEKFLIVGPIFFDKVRQRTLNMSVNIFNDFLHKFEEILTPYVYSRSETVQLLVTHFLDSTMHLWLQQSVATSEVGDKARQLCRWRADLLRRNKIRSWKVRDRFARFLDRYLALDPLQVVWSIASHDEDGNDVEEGLEVLPAAMLPMLGADEDIRVRFRAAVVNARLFSIARSIEHDSLLLYNDIKQWYTVDIDKWVSCTSNLFLLF